MTAHLDRLKAALADRYAIEREIGRGGMATVYLAEDLKHQRHVAIKVLDPELARAMGSERFLREVQVTATLNHPHILPLHDSGEADGVLFYVMPYVEGETLRDRMNREGQLPLDDALQITKEIAAALSHAHSHDVIHRDIKPENVLLSAGEAVVADFGIARAITEAGGEHLTETGIGVGTPAYMSPEQVSGPRKLDGRSDVYSLGCVLYEMLTGEPPYSAPSHQALIAKKLNEPTPRISVVRELVPGPIEVALTKALAKTPADRFRTAQEFAVALSGADVQPAERAAGRRVPHRRRWWGAAAATAVVLLGLGGWWGAHRLGAPAMQRLAVLPLASFTNDSTQQYFVDGVHDALIFDLQQAGVSVISRTSVLQYAHTEKPIHEIARELGVDGVIEGSVLPAGDSVELALRLIDARTEETRWQESYRGEVRNILTLYHGVTRGIAGEIQSTLTPAASAELATARTVDPQAYDDYLRGQFHLHRWTAGDLDAALEYFQRALQRDSTYTPAWLGIFLVWGFRLQLSYNDPLDTLPALVQASVAKQKLLELGGNSAEAQYAIGLSAGGVDWDWVGAERAMRRAIEINPNYAECLAFYGSFLSFLGRFREAHPLIERAIELDPLNPLYRTISGENLAVERRFADAEREFRRVLQTVPDHPMALQDIWAVLWHLGRYDEAVDMLRRLYAGDQDAQDTLTQGLAEGGHRVALRRLAMYLGPRQPSANTGWFQVAIFYALAGEEDSAIANLERAYESHDFNMPNLDRPDFDALRDNPRYRDLCRRMNLPRCAQGSASPRDTARPG